MLESENQSTATATPPGVHAGHGDGLRIVHVLAPGAFGGLERVVQSLAAGQMVLGYHVEVLAVVPAGQPDGPFFEELRGAGVPVTAIAVPPRAYRAEIRLIRAAIERVRPDIVHTHGYRPDVLASGPARAVGAKRISTLHGFTGGDLKNRLYEVLQLRALRRYDAVVAVARTQLDRIARARIPSDRVHVVQNGWLDVDRLDPASARRELGIAADDYHVGWVGRLSHEKGPDVLLEALARAPDLRLTVSIIGDGRERPALEAMAARLGVSDRVRWQGPVANAGRLFAGFDAFVLSSRTEGTPIVLFEAMSSGVPIIATAVGGVPDVLASSEAVLVPPEDPEALANGLRATLQDRLAASERASRARQRLESDFSVETWLRRYDRLYRHLLHQVVG